MKKYECYCSEEQTRKSFELGATIEFEMEYPVNLDTFERSPYPDIKMGKDGEPILITPTVAQMSGWLNDNGIFIHINFWFDNKSYTSEFITHDKIVHRIGLFNSYKDAALLLAIANIETKNSGK